MATAQTVFKQLIFRCSDNQYVFSEKEKHVMGEQASSVVNKSIGSALLSAVLSGMAFKRFNLIRSPLMRITSSTLTAFTVGYVVAQRQDSAFLTAIASIPGGSPLANETLIILREIEGIQGPWALKHLSQEVLDRQAHIITKMEFETQPRIQDNQQPKLDQDAQNLDPGLQWKEMDGTEVMRIGPRKTNSEVLSPDEMRNMIFKALPAPKPPSPQAHQQLQLPGDSPSSSVTASQDSEATNASRFVSIQDFDQPPYMSSSSSSASVSDTTLSPSLGPSYDSYSADTSDKPTDAPRYENMSPSERRAAMRRYRREQAAKMIQEPSASSS